MQRGFRILRPKRDVPIKSLPLGLRELGGRGGGKNIGAKEMDDTKKTKSSKQHN